MSSEFTAIRFTAKDQLTLDIRYQGDMSRAMRDKAVRAFMSKDKATVMLMSLKCGGVGLNLTRANRVINMDLGAYDCVLWRQHI